MFYLKSSRQSIFLLSSFLLSEVQKTHSGIFITSFWTQKTSWTSCWIPICYTFDINMLYICHFHAKNIPDHSQFASEFKNYYQPKNFVRETIFAWKRQMLSDRSHINSDRSQPISGRSPILDIRQHVTYLGIFLLRKIFFICEIIEKKTWNV